MTQYSKYNIVYRLQKWMDSVPGQTFLNYGYSWGASVVILGALFKLTHLPGANIMLYFGMGTEVIVFFLSAFDRPFDKTDDGRDLPTHITDEYLEGTESEAGTTEHHTGNCSFSSRSSRDGSTQQCLQLMILLQQWLDNRVKPLLMHNSRPQKW